MTLSTIERSISEPLPLPVLGQHHHALAGSPARGDAQPHRLAGDLDRSAGGRFGPEDRACDLGPAAADQPGQPDDLAGADLERDVR